jgi:hypothetical protein
MPIARNLIAIFPETTFYGSVDIVVVANWKTTATTGETWRGIGEKLARFMFW